MSFAVTFEFMGTLVCPACHVPLFGHTLGHNKANVISSLELSSVS
jgi:hypothetical protein